MSSRNPSYPSYRPKSRKSKSAKSKPSMVKGYLAVDMKNPIHTVILVVLLGFAILTTAAAWDWLPQKETDSDDYKKFIEMSKKPNYLLIIWGVLLGYIYFLMKKD